MHRTTQNTSRLTKVVRTVGITVGIVAGSASAASAVNGGSFVPSFLSEPTTTTAPLVATTTPKITKAPEPTPTTTAAPTTTKALEPTPTTAKALEPTPTTTKALEPTPTTAKALEPTPTTTKAPEPTPTTKAPAPTTKAPEPTTAKALEPTTTPTTKAPEPTTTTKAPEVHTPESLQLSCQRKTDGDRVGVTCSWTGDLPAGGTTFMLLRGGGGVGRVLVSGPNAHSFIDSTIQPGVAYSYTAVVPGAPGSPTLAHGNQVSIMG